MATSSARLLAVSTSSPAEASSTSSWHLLHREYSYRRLMRAPQNDATALLLRVDHESAQGGGPRIGEVRTSEDDGCWEVWI